MIARPLFATGIVAAMVASAVAAPKVVNPSFEADRFGKFPGNAAANGGKIRGWTFTGGVGLDPVWQDPGIPSGLTHVFNDNGITPDGDQVAVLHGRCTLTQQIEGFEAKKRYRITFYENARCNSRSKEPPLLEVTLGGQTIVSSHRITAVERADVRTLPYHFVESAIFQAPRSGALELVFKSTLNAAVAVLIDKVSVEEVAP